MLVKVRVAGATLNLPECWDGVITVLRHIAEGQLIVSAAFSSSQWKLRYGESAGLSWWVVEPVDVVEHVEVLADRRVLVEQSKY